MSPRTRIPLFFLGLCCVLSHCGNIQPVGGISLEGETLARSIPHFQDQIPESCEEIQNEATVVTVPNPINKYETLQEYPFIEYCFTIPVQDKMHHPLLYLGYIDHFYRVYWNGKLIGSTETYEKGNETVIADTMVALLVPEVHVLPENTLIVQVEKNTEFEERGGIFTGHPSFLPKEEFRKEEIVKEAYEFSRVVVFLSAGVLFLVIFAGKTKNHEYFWFAIYLLAEGLYFSTQLQIQFYLHWNVNAWKRAEYILLTFQIPLFYCFLRSILEKSLRSVWTLFVVGGEAFFAVYFLFAPDIDALYSMNQTFHIPFLLVAVTGFFLLLAKESFQKNPKAILLLVLLLLPGIISFLEILNTRFSMFPILSQYKIAGEASLLMVLSMGLYLSYEFYKIEVFLNQTISKEAHLRKTFQLYVPPQDLEKILQSFGEGMGNFHAELEERVILFCDMRNFTKITEKLNPIETVDFLNSYFEVFSDIVTRHKGVIDKLIGDCIMARFYSEDAALAIQASILMQTELLPFNRKRKEKGLEPIQHGIGLAMGYVVEGNIGSTNKMDYTVIGDSVNLASRLESLTKYYGVSILVTEDIVKRTEYRFLFREIDTLRVKGKSESVKVFEPMLLFIPENSLETSERVAD